MDPDRTSRFRLGPSGLPLGLEMFQKTPETLLIAVSSLMLGDQMIQLKRKKFRCVSVLTHLFGVPLVDGGQRGPGGHDTPVSVTEVRS